jgi:formate-dependent nitrite reductase membrane component NrfD
MNPFVVDPDWGWWIILYFFFGGIAAGAYYTATLIDLTRSEKDSELARMGYWVAFPLISLCAIFLIVDLGQPQRFWHMLLKSEVVHAALAEGWPWSGGWGLMLKAPLFKDVSPMSVGSWALLAFGLCSFLSFLGSLWPAGRLAWLFRRSWFGQILEVVGCLVGFFVAAYTGALLTATNQPVWSESPWIAPLFLTSAASTGIAVIIVLARLRKVPPESLHHLEQADLFVMGLELVVFAIFLGSLDTHFWPLWSTTSGKVLVLGTLVLGLLIPFILHLRLGMAGLGSALAASFFALAGGLLLRYGILTTAPELLARGPSAFPGRGFSPEDGRVPGRSRGADPGNYPDPAHPDQFQPGSENFHAK